MTYPNKSKDVTGFSFCSVRHFEDKFVPTFIFIKSLLYLNIVDPNYVTSHLSAEPLPSFCDMKDRGGREFLRRRPYIRPDIP